MPVTYSGFSHHPAGVLKAVHCVHIAPLTCWFCLISATADRLFYPPTPTLFCTFTETPIYEISPARNLNHVSWTLK